MTTLGRHPDALTVKLTLGDGAHLIATAANGWAGPVTLHYGPSIGDPVISDTGTVDGDTVSWTLTEEQVTARAGQPMARLEDNGMTVAAGNVIVWRGGLGSTQTQTIASLVAGPPGPTAVSADADNAASLGSDGKIYVPPSSASAEGIQDVVGAMIVAAGGTYDDEAGTITLPSSGGSGGTLTATDTPAAPAEGTSASYLVTSAVTWPAGLVWSTDPDGGTEPTITTAALVSLFTVGGTTYAVMGSTYPVPVAPDTTDPTPGTLAASSITGTGFTLTVTGASDETALDATPYAFSTDNGATYSAWQESNVYTATGLTASTAYDCVHKVRDAAANVATGTAIEVTTGASGDPLAGIDFVWRFESDSITGVADGDPVATWPDTSGNGYDATQAIAADRPTYDVDAFGSQPGLIFGNSTTKRLTTPTLAATLSQPGTVWLVGSAPHVTSVTQYLFSGVNAASNRWGASQTQTTTTIVGTNAVNVAPVDVETPGVFAFLYNGLSSQAWGSGVTSGVKNTGTSGINGLTIGNYDDGALSMRGALGAILVVPEVQSTADMNTVGNYLAAKYGFTWTDL